MTSGQVHLGQQITQFEASRSCSDIWTRTSSSTNVTAVTSPPTRLVSAKQCWSSPTSPTAKVLTVMCGENSKSMLAKGKCETFGSYWLEVKNENSATWLYRKHFHGGEKMTPQFSTSDFQKERMNSFFIVYSVVTTTSYIFYYTYWMVLLQIVYLVCTRFKLKIKKKEFASIKNVFLSFSFVFCVLCFTLLASVIPCVL